eukprot:1228620-Alexandrium_andersonii.AAC.1
MSASLVGSEMCIRDSPGPILMPSLRWATPGQWYKFERQRQKLQQLLEIYAQGDWEGPIGPVGLMLKSCAEFGIAVGPTGVAGAQGEIPLDLVRAPWQQLKRSLQDRACRSAIHEAEQKRPPLAGSGELDMSASLSLMSKLEGPERTLLRRILVGGVWSQTNLVGAGFEQCELCPWCREAKGTHLH